MGFKGGKVEYGLGEGGIGDESSLKGRWGQI